ncbi:MULTISPECIES: minor capsid protein [Lactobacillus]|uniref:phage head morphogenesis protein n=1 Tax=Lactobacillus TaxID=1578 RepID=UPI000CD810FC|nr:MULTISPECIES: minor capsid protein [Lactobacillus]RVU73448.1 head protein [Lactobacillus xujianguonis]
MPKTRVPTRYPRKLEEQYAKNIKRLVRDWDRGAKVYAKFYLKRYVKGGTQLKLDDATDDPNWFDHLNQQLQLMAFSMEQASNSQDVNRIATKFVKAINQFSYNNVKAQAAIVGIDPISDNPVLRNFVKSRIAENVSLIESMRSQYLHSLEKDIYRSITKGGGITSITDAITNRTGMARRHADLIANDQTGTIISQLNSYRAKSAGAEKYLWRSMEDRRVRPKHRELDGKTFKYDDANGGDDGQLPGEPIRCRCVAEPIF